MLWTHNKQSCPLNIKLFYWQFKLQSIVWQKLNENITNTILLQTAIDFVTYAIFIIHINGVQIRN